VTPLSWAFLVDSVPFTKAVIAGETSLGGSESACLGLARALKARGHDVHIFTTQFADDAIGLDATGLRGIPLTDFHAMNDFIEWDVVCALRMWHAFAWRPIYARMRLLWNQDLLVPGQMQNGVMGMAWALDHALLRLHVSPAAVGRPRTRTDRPRLGDAERDRSAGAEAGVERSRIGSSTSPARNGAGADAPDVAALKAAEAGCDAADLPLLLDVRPGAGLVVGYVRGVDAAVSRTSTRRWAGLSTSGS
jgi:hypothetical protein